jgi:putative endonuclease
VTAARRKLGIRGESLAARWYEDRGYLVLARNWRTRGGELDLVVRRGDLVAFCEVKTRTSGDWGAPSAAVGPAKQERLRRLAGAYLAAHPMGGVERYRFDVASVVGDEVDLLEAAFTG